MPKTVNAGFEKLVSWTKPSDVETAKAAAHRKSIETRLKDYLGMTRMFRAGSFGHGTSVSGYSDIDYFALFPAANLWTDSFYTLRKLKEDLQARFPLTGVHISSPTVVVPFGTSAAEKHEITPAYLSKNDGHFPIYRIPDRAGGWMTSAPTGHNAYTNLIQSKRGTKVKQVVRIIKLWNYLANAGLRSLYIEMRVAKYLDGETTIVYSIDVKTMFARLLGDSLAAMQDPLGLTGYIYPCTNASKEAALSKLQTALTRAGKASLAESEGKDSDAYYWWRLIFPGWYPAYG